MDIEVTEEIIEASLPRELDKPDMLNLFNGPNKFS